jgi:hypothetical protein
MNAHIIATSAQSTVNGGGSLHQQQQQWRGQMLARADKGA